MEKCFAILVPPKYRPTFPLTRDGVNRATKLVNNVNGRKSVYRTVYNFVKEDENQIAIIDKVFIDFDPDEDGKGGIEDAKVLSAYLKEKKIKHSNFFSGRGAHIYVYTQKLLATELNNASMAIRNFVNKLADETGVTPDYHVVGDLSRVSRVPNTLNTKTKLFCVPVCEAMMGCPENVIMDYAKKQQNHDPIIDGDLVDLRKYDSVVPSSFTKVKPIEGKSGDLDFPNLPLCVQEALRCGEPGYNMRFLIITCMRDLAYSKEEVIEVLEQYLTEEKFVHCVEEEGQVDYLFERDDMLFPVCDTIKAQGYCVEGCNGQNIYY